MIRLAIFVALLPLPALAEVRPHDLEASAICIDATLGHAAKVTAMVAAGWVELPPDGLAPAAEALGAAFVMRTMRSAPEMTVAEAYQFAQFDWTRRTETTETGETGWLQAGGDEATSFLALRTDGDYVSCFIAVPPDLAQEELISLAGLTDKIIAESDIPGGHMVVFKTASTYGGISSVMLPDPAFFAEAGLPVPPVLILTSTSPAP